MATTNRPPGPPADPPPTPPAEVQHLPARTMAEVNAALHAGACVHVRNDADEETQAWQAERLRQAEADWQPTQPGDQPPPDQP